MKLYISPNENGKFGYNSFIMSNPPDVDGCIEATQEMIDGLNNHTLCWQNGKLVEYTKSAEEIAEEEAEKKRREVNAEILALKQKLSATDYQAIKFAEGELTADEYAPTKAERKAWREEINQLELLLNE